MNTPLGEPGGYLRTGRSWYGGHDGLKRGLPDLWILHEETCIELKRPGGQLPKTRIVRTRRGSPRVLAGHEDVFPLLSASGAVCDIAICCSVAEVLDQLAAWGIPLRGRAPPLAAINDDLNRTSGRA